MKKSACLIAAATVVLFAGLSYGADTGTKITPQEYFKHAGKVTDPGYQDYVATQEREEARRRAEERKSREEYAAQQARIRERVKNSPKYTVPNFNKKGSYGQAK